MKKNPKDNYEAQERSLPTRKSTNRFKVTKERSNFLANAVIMTCFGQAHYLLWIFSEGQQFSKASQVKKVANYINNVQSCDPASDKVLTQERSLSIRKFTNRFKVTKGGGNFLANAVIMTCFEQVRLIWNL